MKLRKSTIPGFLLALLLFAGWGCGKDRETTPEKAAPGPSTQATGEATGYRAADVENGGVISGKVIFQGKSKMPAIPVTKDQEVCGKSKKDPSLVVSERGEVQNAVVYIADIHKGKTMEPQEVTLNQKNCEYHPHVLAFPAGSTVEVKNPDGILHNIHSYSEKNDPFNLAQPKFKKTLTVTIEKPEIISVKCDVHGWMSGWFFVAENPYYSLTEDNGSFQLTGVPPGRYSIQVWHEELGKQSKDVKVEPDERTEIEFEFPRGVDKHRDKIT